MAGKTYAQQKAELAYRKRKYDSKSLQMPKGTLEQLKALADAEGVSVSRYILEAVEMRSGLKLTLDGEFKTKK